MKKNIVAMVTLYNPKDEVYDNIMSYLPSVDCVFVVCNSFINNKLYIRLKKHDKINIIQHDENKGIAYSLNEIINLVEGKYKWILTMDQDSFFYAEKVEEYLSSIDKVNCESVYGITSVINNDNYADDYTDDYTVAYSCITSGMILNVDLAMQCHGFDEDLFIDGVDNEFCYRCNSKGYKLIKRSMMVMNHTIGEPRYVSFLGIRIYIENEKPFRLYYIYRNALYIIKRYPNLKKIYIKSLLIRFIKIIFFEEYKCKKIKYITKGIMGAIRKEKGKILLKI